jgi:ribosome biogenesis GTPase
MYHIDEETSIIDSPGFQEFGLHHLTEGMLERAFPEFAPHLGKCKFYNCHHINEPECAILGAVKSGEIASIRHTMYAQLRHESLQTIGY